MDVAQPGRAIGREIGRGEAVEHERTAFIKKRHEQHVKTEGERDEEAVWRESERRYAAARDARLRLEWAEYHQGQAAHHRAVLEALIARHEAAAERRWRREP